jgi:predicted phage baseplate assembly protein
MSLPAPLLDDRRFEDLLRDLQQLIPLYTPELALGQEGWTDWNESDPGTTLLQLWAHLAETILYRVNRIPDRAYVKFLELVGLQLRPAKAATADLTFTPQPGFVPPPHRDGITVPKRTQVRAQPPDGGVPLTFETEEGLDLVRAELASVQVADGGAFTDVTGLNGPAGTAFRPLGWVPQPGNALYLGFAPPDPPVPGRVFPRAMRIRVFLPPAADDALRCEGGAPAPAPPVTLVWEYRRSEIDTRWRRLETLKDGTLGFTRGGFLLLAGPAEIDPVDRLGRVAESRFWLRCRLSAGAYPAGRPPEVDFLRINTVRAENLATVRDEVVGTSEGHPSQTFALRKSPMQPTSLTLQVEEGGEFVPWERQDDLLASAPRDRHYTIDGASGTVAFGDGRRSRIPVAGARIVAKEYRHGASAAGNVAAGLITSLATSLPGVQEVVNLRPAVGGADVQAIDELRRDAPAELRTLRRAVTGADYAALARQVGTVARAVALPLAHPDHRNVDVPGAVTVVVVPDNDDPAPRPSPELLESVCRHLDAARTIATELHVVGPRYHEIKVTARVEAEPYASFDTVRQAVAGAINAALDPLGRPPPPLPGEETPAEEVRASGREFGRDFPPTSLFGIILDVDDVAAVPFLEVELDGSPWDEPSRPIVLGPDELLYGAGDHKIAVVALQERTNGSAP